jgi:hypothetical protein
VNDASETPAIPAIKVFEESDLFEEVHQAVASLGRRRVRRGSEQRPCWKADGSSESVSAGRGSKSFLIPGRLIFVVKDQSRRSCLSSHHCGAREGSSGSTKHLDDAPGASPEAQRGQQDHDPEYDRVDDEAQGGAIRAGSRQSEHHERKEDG